ncbi:MAG TPA: NUMOD4 motif-containing HNH endonuclease [Ferruginibacter sp.]|nr:NUMOD4 motif-containing HNH endonuclease [Ferruginibacter sp.]
MFTTTNTTTILTTLNFAREQWKSVDLGEGYSNETKLEISDFGRLRITNRYSKGRISSGSVTNGYQVLNLKLFRPRDPKTAATLANERAALLANGRALRQLIKQLKNPALAPEEKASLQLRVNEEQETYNKQKTAYQKRQAKDAKARTHHFAGLVHRLVALAFLPTPRPEETVLIHLDHNKLNNRLDNLRWVTNEAWIEHNRQSPTHVDFLDRHLEPGNMGAIKLTVTKVMYLKKLLNEGKSIKSLAKQFKISERQVSRIQNKISWAQVEAAH